MANQLTKEQLLLLNNLMYMGDIQPLEENNTIGQIINRIDMNSIQDDETYTSYTTGKEWKNIIEAIRNDSELMDMQIVQTHQDNAAGGGGGYSALFVNPSTNEAVVAFKGTEGGEWKDNFLGGTATDMPDGVSTQQQSNALDWYRELGLDDSYSSITVTGHSKGGNKAKYITILDDSVDRCVSFDGQGFSDEFMYEYSEQISQNQSKIENHNAASDYVNLLLNDVGEAHFYESQDIGEGGFIENHCPNTLIGYEDGQVVMTSCDRDPRMKELDEFLNSYLRSLSPEKKVEALAVLGELAELGFNGASADEIIGFLTDHDSYNSDHVTDLVSFLIAYSKENPNFLSTIISLLNEFGSDAIIAVVQASVVLIIAMGIKHLPDGILNFVIEMFNLDITVDELRRLLELVDKVDSDSVQIADGSDIQIYNSVPITTSGSGRRSFFHIHFSELQNAEQSLNDISCSLRKYSDEVEQIARTIDMVSGDLQEPLMMAGIKLGQEADLCDQFRQALGKIIYLYQSAEQNVVDRISSSAK